MRPRSRSTAPIAAPTKARAHGGERARLAAHADRQGVRDRHRQRGRLARRPGARRHGLHRGDRRRAALPRRPHRRDLRGHQRHPGDRSRDPQAADVGRRAGARLYRRAAAHRRRGRRPPTIRPSARPARGSPTPIDSLDTGDRMAAQGAAERGGARRRDALSAAVRPCRRRRLAGGTGAGRGAHGAATAPLPRASRWRDFLPRTSRSQRAGSSARSPRATTA